ncbi:MAG: BamA/TamA family outer membrane protein [Deltaproteobacteria bacterium]|nr:BamA/TamA family outer membrane protein [Deltaproteobacteria bacterium]
MPELARPLANWFHVTSLPRIIAQEVLVAPGEAWDQALIDQSARNLRGLSQLSLVLLVPLRGSAPDRVRLLVITKDVWSLRLNSSYVFADGKLQQLFLQPSEENLLGTHQALRGDFILDPATISLGLEYSIPRIAGSRVAAGAAVAWVMNRDTNKSEGSFGSLSLGAPLYSTRDEWAWSTSFAWRSDIRRRFIGGGTSSFDPAQGFCVANETAAPGLASCSYRRTVAQGAGSVTRSFGADDKLDVIAGFSGLRSVYRPFDLSALDAATQAAFLHAVLPRSDSQVGPSLSLHLYSSRFLDLQDVDTLGLVENVRRGHELTLRVAPVLTALGSSRDFVELFALGVYTLPMSDGLVRLSVQSDLDVASGDLPDASLDVSLRVVSPRLSFGRFVLDARVLNRYRNYLNLKSTLGGDTRLRGYAAGLFSGNDLAVGNLEFRSRALELWAVQFGGAVFVDAGDAFDRFDQMSLKESCGLGLRVVFPQLQRSVIRVDFGVPLTRPWLGRPDLVITIGQALPVVGG